MNVPLSPGEDRVRRVTADQINRKIDAEIIHRIKCYSSRSTGKIKARIKQLDKEWDIERTLELNASTIAFSGIILAATISKRWLILPALITAFLAQHAIQGWCPPLPLLRKLGVRTQKEIETERHGLIELLDHR